MPTKIGNDERMGSRHRRSNKILLNCPNKRECWTKKSLGLPVMMAAAARNVRRRRFLVVCVARRRLADGCTTSAERYWREMQTSSATDEDWNGLGVFVARCRLLVMAEGVTARRRRQRWQGFNPLHRRVARDPFSGFPSYRRGPSSRSIFFYEFSRFVRTCNNGYFYHYKRYIPLGSVLRTGLEGEHNAVC